MGEVFGALFGGLLTGFMAGALVVQRIERASAKRQLDAAAGRYYRASIKYSDLVDKYLEVRSRVASTKKEPHQ